MEPGTVLIGSERLNVMQHVEFSRRLYTLLDLWNECSPRMPMLVLVREGFSGTQWSGLEEISQEEVYWITNKGVTEPRIIAKEGGKYNSLSLDDSVSAMSVVILDHKGNHVGSPVTIGDIIKNHRLPVTVQVRRQHRLSQLLGPDQNILPFQKLQIIQVYQYKYLIGYTVDKNIICTDRPRVIPVYVPIRVCPAVEHDKLYKDITRVIMTKCRLSPVPVQDMQQFRNDIMVYTEEEVTQSLGIFDSITPTQVLSMDYKKDSDEIKPRQKSKDNKYTKPPTKEPETHIYETLKPNTAGKKHPEPAPLTFPDDISKLGITELAECLHKLNLGEFAPDFIKCQIDGALLKEMDPSDLKEQFNMNHLLAKKLCLFAKGEWRPKT